jgi:uncharacterized membrane protein
MKKILSIAAAVAVLSLAGVESANAVPEGKEKCYGIAEAGKNDCGANGHSCAGMAKMDKDHNEWKAVDKGTCEDMGGALEAADKAAEDNKHAH